jgi:hypothetical protein
LNSTPRLAPQPFALPLAAYKTASPCLSWQVYCGQAFGRRSGNEDNPVSKEVVPFEHEAVDVSDWKCWWPLSSTNPAKQARVMHNLNVIARTRDPKLHQIWRESSKMTSIRTVGALSLPRHCPSQAFEQQSQTQEAQSTHPMQPGNPRALYSFSSRRHSSGVGSRNHSSPNISTTARQYFFRQFMFDDAYRRVISTSWSAGVPYASARIADVNFWSIDAPRSRRRPSFAQNTDLSTPNMLPEYVRR